jgi:hypothetical protein
MRVWDISPGYLNRDSLLGEHREIHALLVVLRRGQGGYVNHPETRRWQRHETALSMRHQVVAAEMKLRGYVDRTPASSLGSFTEWPTIYLDRPAEQFRLLEERYRQWGRGGGRIPFPRNRQQLWAQHKYSVLARSQESYRHLGPSVSGERGRGSLDGLAEDLVGLLRKPPSPAGVRNAAAHVWGYVSSLADPGLGRQMDALLASDPLQVLALAFRLAQDNEVEYLLHSTVFSDLPAFTRTAA